MKGTWKLRLRMILTSVIMFTLVYFLIMMVGAYLGITSWQLYFGASLLISFVQYWFGPSLVKRSMNVRPLSEAEAPHIHQMVQELADAAGVSVFTISAVENGKTTSLLTLIQMLRALEHLDYLDSFFQEEAISPIAYAKLIKNNKKKERVKSSADNPKKIDSEW
jgi:DNA-binding XRE family transcriptional regulator